jgi:hypothetical protein
MFQSQEKVLSAFSICAEFGIPSEKGGSSYFQLSFLTAGSGSNGYIRSALAMQGVSRWRLPPFPGRSRHDRTVRKLTILHRDKCPERP